MARPCNGADGGHQFDVTCTHAANHIQRHINQQRKEESQQCFPQSVGAGEKRIQAETGNDAAQIQPVWNSPKPKVVSGCCEDQSDQRAIQDRWHTDDELIGGTSMFLYVCETGSWAD